MHPTRPAPLAPVAAVSAAHLAKAALRRLAAERLEPTPENYERAYRHESGEGETSAEALVTLIERVVRGLERGGHNWTPARRKEGIHRVFAGSRSYPKKLQPRLAQLVNNWEAMRRPRKWAASSTPPCRPPQRRQRPPRPRRGPNRRVRLGGVERVARALVRPCSNRCRAGRRRQDSTTTSRACCSASARKGRRRPWSRRRSSSPAVPTGSQHRQHLFEHSAS